MGSKFLSHLENNQTYGKAPREHLAELTDRTKDNKERLNSLADLSEKFSEMSKQELMNELVITHNKFNKISEELEDKERVFKNAIEGMCDFSKSYSKLWGVLWDLGYEECKECGTWKKRNQ